MRIIDLQLLNTWPVLIGKSDKYAHIIVLVFILLAVHKPQRVCLS